MFTTPAFAQSTGDWNGLPDRFQIDTGYFRRSADTLERDFTWGGEDYKAGLSASTSTGGDILGGYGSFLF